MRIVARFMIMLVVVLCGPHAHAAAQDETLPRPLTGRDAIAAILAAFETHDLIAIPDAHGNAEAHAFLLRLLQHPQVPEHINDIVIETGNARYQDLVDRYVAGQEVPALNLRRVWQDTTISTAGNTYESTEAVLNAVRLVNASRRGRSQIRVLLGDPPIDWAGVASSADYLKYFALRDSFPASRIITDVLARGRKALVVYGALHFQRRNILTNYRMQEWQGQTIVSLIESATPARVFTIWEADQDTAGVDAATWTWPLLASVEGTTLGASDFATLVPGLAGQRSSFESGGRVPVAPEEFDRLTVAEQLDAVLYLGPRSPSRPASQIPSALCREPGFVEEQVRRIGLSAPRFEAEALQEHCRKVLSPVQ